MASFQPHPSATPRRGPFSDRLEHRRGLRDAELGRAPASMAGAYLSGYAEGRKRSPRRERLPRGRGRGSDAGDGSSRVA